MVSGIAVDSVAPTSEAATLWLDPQLLRSSPKTAAGQLQTTRSFVLNA